jgi:formylglycine-generating enzyme required for sulfatase activity
MVVVPAGRITMGSPNDEPQRESLTKGSENQLSVTIAKPFGLGRFGVTRGEFAAFAVATGHETGGCFIYTGSEWKQQPDKSWRSPGFTQTDRHPVVCVNWHDAKAYVAWLASATGKSYRLMSETEREYATRAGTTTPFWWGPAITPAQANYNSTAAGPYSGSLGEWRKAPLPVDSFAANPWGLYNVHGNVWEWTEDCANDSNTGNPTDGHARATGDCTRRVLRGGSWFNSPQMLRSAVRVWNYPDFRSIDTGFRVARMLD